jgi:hypothetical protein
MNKVPTALIIKYLKLLTKCEWVLLKKINRYDEIASNSEKITKVIKSETTRSAKLAATATKKKKKPIRF